MRNLFYLFLLSFVFGNAQPQKVAVVTGMAGSTFNPSTLSPILFINPYKDAYVSTIDNNGTRQRGNIIDNATATSGQALATSGTLGSKPIFNGEGWYFSDGAQMTTGSVSDYNFFHTGGDFEIFLTVFICPTASTTYSRAVLCNNGFSNTAKGILLRLNSSAGNNNLEFRCGNGSSAFISLTASGALTVNAQNRIRVRRSGSTATMFVNGTQVATQTISLGAGTGDAAAIMNVCQNTASSAQVYFKDVVVFNRALSTNEATSMNSRRFINISPEPINVYIRLGDSNCAGRGVNASIAGDLSGSISGTMMETFVGAPDYTSWSGKLILGTNQTISSENPSTQHGSEMRFGKSMGALKETCIIKWGRGSHSLFARGGALSPDFNIGSASGAYSQLISALAIQLNDLVHTQRRTPVFRGIEFIIGANDATFADQLLPWTRSGTSATFTRAFHGLVVGGTFAIYNSTDTSAIPTGLYTITANTTNTFTVTVPNAGGTSGTASYSGAYYFKQNSYDIINGIITNLTSTIKNQLTNGTGYTVNKLRLYFPRTYATTTVNTEAYGQVTTAQTEMGTNFLTDNPSRSANVLGSYSETTSDLGMQDGVHYSTSGYDGLGTKEYNYYSQYINE